MNKVAPIMKAIFKKRVNQNDKLLKNIERYEQKEKAKQSKPEVLGQKPVKQKASSKESTRMYHS
jgi:hypothetical protein